MLSKAHRVMYGVTSNSGPFKWLDNFSTRIFPFLLNTSTKFSSTLKWKAGISSLRWVAHRCPAEQQYKLLVLKTGQQMAELSFTIKFKKSLWPRLWATVPSDNVESNDGYVSPLEIEHNRRISDGAEQHFNFPYHCFKPLAFSFKHKTYNKNIFKCTNHRLITANEYFSLRQ